MEPARNDLCPCGSGKKYKKCCLLKADLRSSSQHRLRKTADPVAKILLPYAMKVHGEGGIFEAWEDFWAGHPHKDFSAQSLYLPLFVPWYLYHWYPAVQDELDPGRHFPCQHTVVAQFLRKQAYTVDAYTRRYLEAASQEPLSFWQIDAIEPGKGLLVKDLALDRECFVHEVAGSTTFSKWDLLLAQVVGVDGEYILSATGPYRLPAKGFRAYIAEYLETKKLTFHTPLDLLGCDIDFLEVYHHCVENALNPTPPQLHNTDGEELVLTSSSYDFGPHDRDQVIQSLAAVKDLEGGDIRSDETEYVWVVKQKDAMLDSTLKGKVIVGSRQLTLECNSEPRDKKLREMIEKELGAVLVYSGTTAKPMDDLPRPSGSPQGLDLATLPETERNRLTEMIEQQYLRWAEVKVPALDDRTPREAVKTPEGRRQVADLINDWENLQAGQQSPQVSFDFNRLRAALGLDLE